MKPNTVSHEDMISIAEILLSEITWHDNLWGRSQVFKESGGQEAKI